MGSRYLSLAVVAGGMLTSGAAMAQAGVALISIAGVQSTADHVSHPGESAAGDDIIVTARRSAEDIQSTPVSVTAFNAETLRSAGIRQTSDLMVRTPGVFLGGSGARENSTFQIRGQSKSRNGFNAPAVISYFADVPMPTFGSNVETFDLSSVQVLKGPQGTLFGRNTTGGAVLFYPAAPTYEVSGYAEASYGNYDARQLEGAVNFPIVADKVSVRVAGRYEKRDGYTRNLTLGLRLDNRNARAFRASLLLEPAEGFRNLTIYDYYHNSYNGDSVVLTGLRAVTPLLPGARDAALAVLARQQARGPRQVEGDGAPRYVVTRKGVTNRTDIELGGGISFVNIFGFRRTEGNGPSNIDALPQLPSTVPVGGIPAGTPLTFLNGGSIIHTEQYTDEVQFKGSLFDDRVDWLIGGFFLHSNPYGPNGAGSKQFSAEPPSVPFASFGYNFLTEDSRAIFGNVNIGLDDVVDGLKLNLGARYTWDRFKSCTATDTIASAGVVGRVQPGVCDARQAPLINPATNRGKSEAPTWQASLEWQATPDFFTYVVTRRGYRAGGINSPTFAGRLIPFQQFGPEKVTDLEAGLRSDWRLGGDVRFRFNASAFIGWYDGVTASLSGVRTNAGCVPGAPPPLSPDGDCITTNDPTSGALTANVGKSRVWGIDVDGFVAVGNRLRFTYAGNLLRPKSTDFQVPAVIAPYVPTGTTLAFDFVARHTYSLGAQYILPLGDAGEITANADLYHSGKLAFVDRFLPAYTVVNSRIDWNNVGGMPIDLSVWATNLFDKEYAQMGVVNGPSAGIEGAIFAPPRMYGLSLRYRFGQ